jgi:geranylgeranyl pyrophosphate synthase
LSNDLSAWFKPRRELVDGAMAQLFGDCWSPHFVEAVHYALLGGGKRMRPAIVIAAYEALAGEDAELSAVLPAAISVELIHSYSLVHDDLPAMDDDDERRGRPTVHIAFDEAIAILVGDALLTEAFSVLADGPWSAEVRVALVRELGRSAGYRGMVGGQVADTGAGSAVSEAELRALHERKTGALIRASALMGGLVAGASEGELAALAEYGSALGMAFQLSDDLLDSDEDGGEGGPPSYVKLLGADETQRRAHEYAARAIAAVGELPGPRALSELARFTVRRAE